MRDQKFPNPLRWSYLYRIVLHTYSFISCAYLFGQLSYTDSNLTIGILLMNSDKKGLSLWRFLSCIALEAVHFGCSEVENTTLSIGESGQIRFYNYYQHTNYTQRYEKLPPISTYSNVVKNLDLIIVKSERHTFVCYIGNQIVNMELQPMLNLSMVWYE